jgi:hypothetical protein
MYGARRSDVTTAVAMERMHTLENAQARPLRRIPAQVTPGMVLEPEARARVQDADDLEVVARPGTRFRLNIVRKSSPGGHNDRAAPGGKRDWREA